MVPSSRTLRLAPLALAAAFTALLTAQAAVGLLGRGADAFLHDIGVNVVAALCALAAIIGARRRGPARSGRRLVALGLVLIAVGNTAWTVLYASATVSPADLICLASGVCLFAGIVALGRSWGGAAPRVLWLDGASAVLAALALSLTTLVPLVVDSGDATLRETLANLSYPVLDIAMLVAVVVLVALRGTRPSPALAVLLGAVLALGFADGLGVWWLTDTADVTLGRLIDAGWSWSWLLFATATLLPMPRTAAIDPHSPRVVVIPLLAVATCVGLLATGQWDPHPLGAILAAIGAIIVAAGRSVTTFATLRALAQDRRLAVVDDLTGLPNRRLLMGRLGACAAAGRDVVVLLLDIDGFKEVNDTLGHVVGDRLLERVAARLGAATDEMHVIARLGGDEFAVHLAPGSTLDDGRAQAARLRAALDAPIEVDGLGIRVEVSVGIAALGGRWTAEEALRRADVAMYRAKAQRTGTAVYDGDDDRHTRERITVAAAVRDGLARGEITIAVQPMIDARGAFAAAEALVRWRHPTRGVLGPGAFLPEVQHTALMTEMTDRVLALALAARATWAPDAPEVPIAVNLSPQDLRDPRLPARVRAALAAAGAPAHALCLEISESAVAADVRGARDALAVLSGLGCRLALDDFGTGHSSLAYLRDLRVDQLKIDRSFVTGLPDDEWSIATITAAVALARARGLEIVGEGAEDVAAVRALTDLGVDLVQGFSVARPMPAADVAAWIREVRPRLVTAG